ncbi:hypothetical protein MDAP_000874 [Mitosporidium daphniae]
MPHVKRIKQEAASAAPFAKAVFPIEVLEVVFFYMYSCNDFQSILAICNRTLFSYYMSRLNDSIEIPGDIGRKIFLAPPLFSEVCVKNTISLGVFSDAIFSSSSGISRLSISGKHLPTPPPLKILSALQDKYFWVRNIKNLEFSHIKIPDRLNVQALRSNIGSVTLSHVSGLEDHLICFLSLFPKLNQISLLHSSITPSNQIHATGKRRFSSLTLVKNSFSHVDFDKTHFFKWIAGFLDLYQEPCVLELNGVKMSHGSFLRLVDFKRANFAANRLQCVSLDNCTFYPQNEASSSLLAHFIRGLPELKRFSIRNFQLDVTGIKRGLLNLVELDLSFNSSITNDVLHDIVTLSRLTLRSLSLEGIQSISTGFLCGLVMMLKLEKLNVSNMAIKLSQFVDDVFPILFGSLQVIIAKNCYSLCSSSFIKVIKSVTYHSPLRTIDFSDGTCSNIRIETLVEAKTYLSKFACKFSH